jgi:diadenosine tetraphosphate (Ap4A) HIT family hydrolase
VRVADPDHPAFLRVIWNAHVREVTDLEPAAREHLMRAVFAVEAALRAVMAPHKVNLASLGNVTPHLHWHVIARWPDDAHYPGPIWAARQRASDATTLAARRAQWPQLDVAVRAALAAPR